MGRSGHPRSLLVPQRKKVEIVESLDHKIIVCKDFDRRNPRSLLKSFERDESFREDKKMQKEGRKEGIIDPYYSKYVQDVS